MINLYKELFWVMINSTYQLNTWHIDIFDQMIIQADLLITAGTRISVTLLFWIKDHILNLYFFVYRHLRYISIDKSKL